jgi:ABC-type proline/glycine betaine transport system ATPase subunit
MTGLVLKDMKKRFGGTQVIRGVDLAERERRFNEAAATLKLDALLHRYPRELSGGQRIEPSEKVLRGKIAIDKRALVGRINRLIEGLVKATRPFQGGKR